MKYCMDSGVEYGSRLYARGRNINATYTGRSALAVYGIKSTSRTDIGNTVREQNMMSLYARGRHINATDNDTSKWD